MLDTVLLGESDAWGECVPVDAALTETIALAVAATDSAALSEGSSV